MLQASGSCIFESIQRGEIDRVSHLLQQDRGVLKQKGEYFVLKGIVIDPQWQMMKEIVLILRQHFT